MTDERKQEWRCTNGGVIAGPIWFIGWLFTIGYLGLHFGKAVLALVIWPYYLGAALK